jgi:hypothetical protein
MIILNITNPAQLMIPDVSNPIQNIFLDLPKPIQNISINITNPIHNTMYTSHYTTKELCMYRILDVDRVR